MVCSQAKEGLKPESAREGEHSATEDCAHRQPRALEQPWAEGQCGGAHGKEGPESNAIWRGRDKGGPLPSLNHLTKPSEAQRPCALMSQVSLPATVLSSASREEEEGK